MKRSAQINGIDVTVENLLITLEGEGGVLHFAMGESEKLYAMVGVLLKVRPMNPKPPEIISSPFKAEVGDKETTFERNDGRYPSRFELPWNKLDDLSEAALRGYEIALDMMRHSGASSGNPTSTVTDKLAR